MRILVDACVPGSVVRALRNMGFDVEWIAEWPDDPDDRTILEYARNETRILITRDKDFGELIFRDRLPHCGVLRLAGEMAYAEQARVAVQAISEYSSELIYGRVVTAEHGRTRVSKQPIKQ
jgi:predicted nuclease of predicted toxin-antitoxin system